jgi:hypothetical protein
LIRVRRRGIAVLSGVAGSWAVVSAMAWLALAPWPGGTPGASPADFSKSLGYPTNGSALVYLFLDGGDASRQLAERIERYRQAVPHRIHVLCFVEGVTPPSLLAALRDRHQVHQTPGIVFDGHVRTDAGNPAMVDGTLDRCFNKAPPRLSMELHGGVIGNRHFSLGFIMCNHGLPQDARGNTAMFVFENGVSLGEWKCDRIAKYQVADARPFAIPVRKCLPPSMYKWEIPPSVDPARLGALVLVLDEQGHVIDSICTEKPCARTGVCD